MRWAIVRQVFLLAFILHLPDRQGPDSWNVNDRSMLNSIRTELKRQGPEAYGDMLLTLAFPKYCTDRYLTVEP